MLLNSNSLSLQLIHIPRDSQIITVLDLTYLRTQCVSFVPSLASAQQLVVTLRSSKPDSFQLGQSLIIARTGSQICAVIAIQHYFQLVAPSLGTLFSFQSSRLLTRSAVISLLRDIVRLVGLPFHSLKGHTFRIGAVSTATAVGLPDWLIKIIGRQYFDCYQLYNYKNYLVKCCFLRPQEGPMLLCT